MLLARYGPFKPTDSIPPMSSVHAGRGSTLLHEVMRCGLWEIVQHWLEECFNDVAAAAQEREGIQFCKPLDLALAELEHVRMYGRVQGATGHLWGMGAGLGQENEELWSLAAFKKQLQESVDIIQAAGVV